MGLILLVEDNPDDQVLMIRALKKQKILNEVIIAEDGQEALDHLFGENGKEKIKPVFILLDLKLPRISGIEVLERIKADEETKSIPTIILTTSSEDEDMDRVYNLDGNSYIRKPVDYMEFQEVIGQVGLYWLVINEKNRKEE